MSDHTPAAENIIRIVTHARWIDTEPGHEFILKKIVGALEDAERKGVQRAIQEAIAWSDGDDRLIELAEHLKSWLTSDRYTP